MTTDELVEVRDRRFYFVGIKGTGMAALAELFTLDGALVCGSDVDDRFFTQASLDRCRISYYNGFNPDHVPQDADAVIYSAAYSPDSHPELLQARKFNLPLIGYTEALGAYSRRFHSVGVAGVHGKTTTTAMLGIVLRAFDFPLRLLTGSLVPDFGNSAVLHLGGHWFVAETCEYRRHFLHFSPRNILLTSIEEDHQDYYPDLQSITTAFKEYISLLPEGGGLVYCSDDANVLDLVTTLKKNRPDIRYLPYGVHTEDIAWRAHDIQEAKGFLDFHIGDLPIGFRLSIPGRHNVVNAVGAIAMATEMYRQEFGRGPSVEQYRAAADRLAAFKSTYRRSQVLGEKNGILVMDDYAHHPTAIKKTLEGIKAFYRPRRLVVSFMSHTYSRTQALLEEFARSFESADTVLFHKIYASARESNQSGISGKVLADSAQKYRGEVYYFEEFSDALPFLRKHLEPGDLFLTMGAGDNWKLATSFLEDAN